MKLVQPTGTKKILVQENEDLVIWLEDRDSGSRDFTLEIELQGDGARCEVYGRAQTFGNDQKNWYVKQIFSGKNQTGSIDLRGTAEEKSFLRFDGTALLQKESIDADAKVQERIILFDEAKGKLLPVLTVKTDRVSSASHGASIAPVEREKILYLQSRGISQKSGEKLIKEGFLRSH